MTKVPERNIKRIIISRTDAIGDVVLTLPIAGILKKYIPGCRIIFFGRTYTKPVIDLCEYIDEFINFDEFEKLDNKGRKMFLQNANADAIVHVFPRNSIAAAAKGAGIKIRIGTSNRIFHWWTCNKLIALSRKNSELHEAQLNINLLKGIGIEDGFSKEDLINLFGLKNVNPPPDSLKKYLSSEKFNLIIHPKSRGSSREWSLDNYRELINLLPKEKFNLVITGSQKEEDLLRKWIKILPNHVQDCVNKMELDEFISFINNADGILAASTGPLHLAAALGKYALGIYPPIRPLYPKRWAPLGKNADYIVINKTCNNCRNNPSICHCINEISAAQVAEKIIAYSQKLI